MEPWHVVFAVFIALCPVINLALWLAKMRYAARYSDRLARKRLAEMDRLARNRLTETRPSRRRGWSEDDEDEFRDSVREEEIRSEMERMGRALRLTDVEEEGAAEVSALNAADFGD